MTNYLHGTQDNVAHHVVCSVCDAWTDHETGRVDPDKQKVRLCLACDLFDAENARRRARETEGAVRALLHELAAARMQIVAQAKTIRELGGTHLDPTLDLSAVTGDMPQTVTISEPTPVDVADAA